MIPTDGKSIKEHILSHRAWYLTWAALIALKLILACLRPEPVAPDEGTYLGLARRLLEQHAYLNIWGRPTAGVMPGYPLLLAAVLGLSGGSVAPIYFINVLLTIPIAWAAGRFLVLMTGNRPLGRACMVIVFVFPPFFTYTWHALTEIPYTAALTLLFLVYEKTSREPRVISNWFWLGLLTVTSFMIRPVMFLLTPLYFAWPLIAARLDRRAIAGAAVGTAVVFALWMPWVGRNQRIFHGFVPLATTSGLAFYGATLSDPTKILDEQAAEKKRSGISEKTTDELTVSRHFARLAAENYKKDRAGYYKRAFKNSWWLWPTAYSGRLLPKSIGEYRSEGNWAAAATKSAFALLNLLMLTGATLAFVVFFKKPRWWPYLFVIVYFHAMHAMILPIPRYSLPLTPMMVALGLAAAREVYKAAILFYKWTILLFCKWLYAGKVS